MKKICLITLITLLLVGCNKKNSTEESIVYSIVTPTGAPALAMSYFSKQDNFQTVTDPTKILPLMANKTVDIAVLPTNVGINAIVSKGVEYQIAATITFGNFFVASTGNDEDGVMNPGDYIVSFQQGSVPDKVFHYIYGNELDDSIHYVAGAQDAAKCLKLGKNPTDDNKNVDYVLLAEPALTTVMNSTSGRSIYSNLQELYKVKSGGIELFQASVFVKKTIDKEELNNNFLNELQNSIERIINEEGYLKSLMNEVDDSEVLFGVKADIAQSLAINGNKMGIGYKSAKENKDAINLFISLFGMEEIGDEIISQ